MQREEALKKSEQMLEEDALRFDAFLKENDEKVQEAIKKAEVEAKAKQDKVRTPLTHHAHLSVLACLLLGDSCAWCGVSRLQANLLLLCC